MATRKNIRELRARERLEYLKEKELERIKNPNKKVKFNFNIMLTNREITIIKRKTRYLKAKYNIPRTKVLRKVLLNLSDEDLICFLGLYNI